MRAAVRVNLTPQGVVLEEHDELAGRLNNLQGERMNINSRQPGRKTTMVNGVVCFRERIRVSAERRLGSIVLRLAPGCHGRLFDVELINPVEQPSCRRAENNHGKRGRLFPREDKGERRKKTWKHC